MPDVANIINGPEYIGYLRDIGLDYGWGITASLEWCLEHIHLSLGLGWGASIVALAVAIRVALIKPAMSMADNQGRTSAVQSLQKPIYEKMQRARESRRQDLMQDAYRQMNELNKSVGIGLGSSLRPLLYQSVLGLCTFRLLRAMTELPVPGLQSGGALWLQDLTIADPYLILPVLNAAGVFFAFKVNYCFSSAESIC